MSNVQKLYIIRFFQSLIPAYVIERLFWEERGMTVSMVVIAEIIYAAVIVLLEVPSGIAADKWGRKRLLLLSACIGCLEFLLLVFARQFWHFALVMFMTAIGNSASSGANNALLYDSLLEEGKSSDFEKYTGRLNALDIVSIMIAALCGSLLAGRFGFAFNYWVSFCSMLIALAVTFALREPSRGQSRGREAERGLEEQGEGAVPIRQYWTESIRFFRGHPAVFQIVWIGVGIGAAVNYVDEFWQLYLERLGIPVAAFGLFSAAFFLIRLPGSLFAYRLKERYTVTTLLLAAASVAAAGFLVIALAPNIVGLAALFAVCLVAGIVEPLVSGYLHHRIDSSMRATLDSFQSLALHAAIGLIGLGFGYFASKLDLFGGFGFIAVACALLLLGVAKAALSASHKVQSPKRK